MEHWNMVTYEMWSLDTDSSSFQLHVLCFLFCLSSSCVLCTQCGQFLWIVHSGLPLRFSLTFVYSRQGKFRSHNTSYCLIEVVNKGSLIVLSMDVLLISFVNTLILFRNQVSREISPKSIISKK